MKQVIFILSIGALILLAACGTALKPTAVTENRISGDVAIVARVAVTATATPKADINATIQAAIDATLTAAAPAAPTSTPIEPPTNTPTMSEADINTTIQAAVEATLNAAAQPTAETTEAEPTQAATAQAAPEDKAQAEREKEAKKQVEKAAKAAYKSLKKSTPENEAIWGLTDFKIFGLNGYTEDLAPNKVSKIADSPLTFEAAFNDIWVKGTNAEDKEVKRKRTLALTFTETSTGEWRLTDTAIRNDKPITLTDQLSGWAVLTVIIGFIFGAIIYVVSWMMSDASGGCAGCLSLVALLVTIAALGATAWVGYAVFDSILTGLLLLIPGAIVGGLGSLLGTLAGRLAVAVMS